MSKSKVRVIKINRADEKRPTIFLVESTEAGFRRSSHLMAKGEKVSDVVKKHLAEKAPEDLA